MSKGYLTLFLEVVHALLLGVGAEHGDEGAVTSLLQLLSASVHRLPVNAVNHVLLHDAHTAIVFHPHERRNITFPRLINQNFSQMLCSLEVSKVGYENSVKFLGILF